MKVQISNSTYFFFTSPGGTRPDAQLQTDKTQRVPVLNKISRFSLFRSRDWLHFLAKKESKPGSFWRKRILCTQVRLNQQGLFGDAGGHCSRRQMLTHRTKTLNVSTRETGKNALWMKDLINNRVTKTPKFHCLWMRFHEPCLCGNPQSCFSALPTRTLTASLLWRALSTQRVTRGHTPVKTCRWTWTPVP